MSCKMSYQSSKSARHDCTVYCFKLFAFKISNNTLTKPTIISGLRPLFPGGNHFCWDTWAIIASETLYMQPTAAVTVCRYMDECFIFSLGAIWKVMNMSWWTKTLEQPISILITKTQLFPLQNEWKNTCL